MKTIKTNAVRLLDASGIPCEERIYDVSDGRIDALAIAEKLGESPDQVFKTLVTVSDKKAYFVFVVPASAELDLKKAASAAGATQGGTWDYGAEVLYTFGGGGGMSGGRSSTFCGFGRSSTETGSGSSVFCLGTSAAAPASGESPRGRSASPTFMTMTGGSKKSVSEA